MAVGMLLVTLFVLAVLSMAVFPTLLRLSLADEDLAAWAPRTTLKLKMLAISAK
jgi:hypothetical protein